jgi:hypothetical protein
MSGQWPDFAGYATGATSRGKRALVPAAYLPTPHPVVFIRAINLSSH